MLAQHDEQPVLGLLDIDPLGGCDFAALPLPHHHELRQTCPKGLNPGKAIAEIKKLMVERKI